MNALVFHNLIHHLNRSIVSPQGPVAQLKNFRAQWLAIPAALGRNAGARVLRLGVRDISKRSKLDYFFEKIHRMAPLLQSQCG